MDSRRRTESSCRRRPCGVVFVGSAFAYLVAPSRMLSIVGIESDSSRTTPGSNLAAALLGLWFPARGPRDAETTHLPSEAS